VRGFSAESIRAGVLWYRKRVASAEPNSTAHVTCKFCEPRLGPFEFDRPRRPDIWTHGLGWEKEVAERRSVFCCSCPRLLVAHASRRDVVLRMYLVIPTVVVDSEVGNRKRVASKGGSVSWFASSMIDRLSRQNNKAKTGQEVYKSKSVSVPLNPFQVC